MLSHGAAGSSKAFAQLNLYERGGWQKFNGGAGSAGQGESDDQGASVNPPKNWSPYFKTQFEVINSGPWQSPTLQGLLGAREKSWKGGFQPLKNSVP